MIDKHGSHVIEFPKCESAVCDVNVQPCKLSHVNVVIICLVVSIMFIFCWNR